MRARHSVNEGFGQEFHRKSHSMKRSGPVNELADSENRISLCSSPSQNRCWANGDRRKWCSPRFCLFSPVGTTCTSDCLESGQELLDPLLGQPLYPAAIKLIPDSCGAGGSDKVLYLQCGSYREVLRRGTEGDLGKCLPPYRKPSPL